jgi:hypothetical protein
VTESAFQGGGKGTSPQKAAQQQQFSYVAQGLLVKRHTQPRNNNNKINFKKILDEVLDKKNWQEKWKKIKDFVKKKRGKGYAQMSERDDVFSAILALYAGDEEEEVFSELARLYERFPEEIEFYVP